MDALRGFVVNSLTTTPVESFESRHLMRKTLSLHGRPTTMTCVGERPTVEGLRGTKKFEYSSVVHFTSQYPEWVLDDAVGLVVITDEDDEARNDYRREGTNDRHR